LIFAAAREEAGRKKPRFFLAVARAKADSGFSQKRLADKELFNGTLTTSRQTPR
jgi:hypothetical protein